MWSHRTFVFFRDIFPRGASNKMLNSKKKAKKSRRTCSMSPTWPRTSTRKWWSIVKNLSSWFGDELRLRTYKTQNQSERWRRRVWSLKFHGTQHIQRTLMHFQHFEHSKFSSPHICWVWCRSDTKKIHEKKQSRFRCRRGRTINR